jgi:hypothetical protein
MIRIPRRLKRLARRILFPPPSPAPREVHEWSIGIYNGTTPWQIVPAGHIINPVLTRHDVTDTQAIFVADPFMLRVDGIWYMFFEVMNSKTGKGEIALAKSDDGFKWKYQQIVMAEPFHLSYPYVFAWGGDYYMVPESWQAGAVRLYRATHFPTQWTWVATLLERPFIVDSSVFSAGGHWWMFAETGADFRFDTLRLYSAAALTGPWVEHPKSPIVSGDPHIARPAGRVLVEGNRVIRFAQDCAPKYGLQVFAFEVEELTPELYTEHPLVSSAILGGTGAGWNSHGMHHVDAHQLSNSSWIACVDGYRTSLVSGPPK